jgi:hypothetical protein
MNRVAYKDINLDKVSTLEEIWPWSNREHDYLELVQNEFSQFEDWRGLRLLWVVIFQHCSRSRQETRTGSLFLPDSSVEWNSGQESVLQYLLWSAAIRPAESVCVETTSWPPFILSLSGSAHCTEKQSSSGLCLLSPGYSGPVEWCSSMCSALILLAACCDVGVFDKRDHLR